MADKMTLQQTLSFFRSVIQSGESWTEACESAYSAAMAHLAGMGEPAAWQYRELGKPWRTVSKETYDRYCVGSGYECRTLYPAPPAFGDWDKVRAMVAELRAWSTADQYPDCLETLDDWADKLTAALPEAKP